MAAGYYGCKPWELIDNCPQYLIAHPVWIQWAGIARAAQEDLDTFRMSRMRS